MSAPNALPTLSPVGGEDEVEAAAALVTTALAYHSSALLTLRCRRSDLAYQLFACPTLVPLGARRRLGVWKETIFVRRDKQVSGQPKQDNAAKKKKKKEKKKKEKEDDDDDTQGRYCHVRIMNTNDEPAVVGVASGGVNRCIA